MNLKNVSSQSKFTLVIVALLAVAAAAATVLVLQLTASSNARAASAGTAVTPATGANGIKPDGKPVDISDFAKEKPALEVDAASTLLSTPEVSVTEVPSSDGETCLTRVKRSSAQMLCSTNESFRDHAILGNMPGDGYGLLPEGAEDLNFVLKDGSSTPGKTVNGYFDARSE